MNTRSRFHAKHFADVGPNGWPWAVLDGKHLNRAVCWCAHQVDADAIAAQLNRAPHVRMARA